MITPTDAQAAHLLEALLRAYSPSTQEQPATKLLVDAMTRLGYDAYVDEVGNAVGHLGPVNAARHAMLLGHIDTVPGDLPVRHDGHLLYGRGAVDAKGPLVAFVIAAVRAALCANGAYRDCPSTTHAEHPLRITVVGAVEEEAATSKGARHVLGRYAPDYVVIGEPSGWHRITLGYKGRLLVDYSLEQPTSHSAGEEPSAPEQAVDYWLGVRNWAVVYNAGKQGLFATLDPSLRAIQSDNDGLRERVEMTIGLRLPPEIALDELTTALEALRVAEGGSVRVFTRGHEEAFRAEKRNSLTSAFLAAIRAVGSGDPAARPAFVYKTGTSDMNVVGPVWGCPIVAYGPGDSSLDHTPQEHIDLREFWASIRVLSSVLTRLAEQNS